MKIEILAFGDKMPLWVETGVKNYLKRLPQTFTVNITELPLVKRSKKDTTAAQKKESDLMLSKLTRGSFVVALDVLGEQLDSPSMANKLKSISQQYAHMQVLIGGPEGLSTSCLDQTHARWSLSSLTYAHPVVRLVLAESLYRSWTILNNHPYHK